MTNAMLACYGFQPCKTGGYCDQCQKETAQGYLFSRRTSTNDFWCRACAERDVTEWETLFTTYQQGASQPARLGVK